MKIFHFARNEISCKHPLILQHEKIKETLFFYFVWKQYIGALPVKNTNIQKHKQINKYNGWMKITPTYLKKTQHKSH